MRVLISIIASFANLALGEPITSRDVCSLGLLALSGKISGPPGPLFTAEREGFRYGSRSVPEAEWSPVRRLVEALLVADTDGKELRSIEHFSPLLGLYTAAEKPGRSLHFAQDGVGEHWRERVTDNVWGVDLPTRGMPTPWSVLKPRQRYLLALVLEAHLKLGKYDRLHKFDRVQTALGGYWVISPLRYLQASARSECVGVCRHSNRAWAALMLGLGAPAKQLGLMVAKTQTGWHEFGRVRLLPNGDWHEFDATGLISVAEPVSPYSKQFIYTEAWLPSDRIGTESRRFTEVAPDEPAFFSPRPPSQHPHLDRAERSDEAFTKIWQMFDLYSASSSPKTR